MTTNPMAWRPANNGAGKRMWFLIRAESVPLPQRYYYGPSGNLVRYSSCVNAQRAADRMNAEVAP